MTAEPVESSISPPELTCDYPGHGLFCGELVKKSRKPERFPMEGSDFEGGSEGAQQCVTLTR